MKAYKDDWVEIEKIVLQQQDRNSNLPKDTMEQPLISYIQGFLENDYAELGEEITIRSTIDRKHIGTLVNTNPTFTHHFGKPIKELLDVGVELKEMMKSNGGINE